MKFKYSPVITGIFILLSLIPGCKSFDPPPHRPRRNSLILPAVVTMMIEEGSLDTAS